MNIFSCLLIVCEWFKGRNEHHYKNLWRVGLIRYYFASFVENIIIKIVPMFVCYLNKKPRKEKIVISLTTFPARVHLCHYTLKSLFMQTMRPDKVVLWLAEEQFHDHKLPDCFKKWMAKGLEIRYCTDLRSHKKYFYILQEQQIDELVMTFDDDIIYNPLSIERAYNKHLHYPEAIVSNETKIMRFSKDGTLQTYGAWCKAPDGNKVPDILNSVMSGSGCLYPAGIWPMEMFDIALHKQLAPSADDLWITFYAKHCKIPIVCVDTPARTYTTVCASQKVHLGQVNCLGPGNDYTVYKMIEYFPDIIEKLYKNGKEFLEN